MRHDHYRALAAAALLAALAGCSEPDVAVPSAGTSPSSLEASADATGEPHDPEATTAAPRYTIEDLAGALPRLDEFPAGYGLLGECPTQPPNDCAGPDELDVRSARIIQGGEPGIILQVNLRSQASAEQATKDRLMWRETLGRFDGTFDLPAEQLDGGSFSPGERGHGTVVDANLGAWKGVLSTREYVRVNPDGAAMGDVPDARTEFRLQRGGDLVEVSMELMNGSSAESERQARTWAEVVIARLD